MKATLSRDKVALLALLKQFSRLITSKLLRLTLHKYSFFLYKGAR